jgi:hypothetical protein
MDNGQLAIDNRQLLTINGRHKRLQKKEAKTETTFLPIAFLPS